MSDFTIMICILVGVKGDNSLTVHNQIIKNIMWPRHICTAVILFEAIPFVGATDTRANLLWKVTPAHLIFDIHSNFNLTDPINDTLGAGPIDTYYKYQLTVTPPPAAVLGVFVAYSIALVGSTMSLIWNPSKMLLVVYK